MVNNTVVKSPSHKVDCTPWKKQYEISILVPLQLAEHVEVADQSDQAGHNQVLQFTTLQRIGEPLLPAYIEQITFVTQNNFKITSSGFLRI